MDPLVVLAPVIASLAWPLAIVILALMFRREIRRALGAVREIRYPGGSVTLRDIEKLEASVERTHRVVQERPLTLGAGSARSGVPEYDAIVRVLTEIEIDLFRLHQAAAHEHVLLAPPVGNAEVDELELLGALPPSLAGNLRSFLTLTDSVLRGGEAAADAGARLVSVGTLLMTEARHHRLVAELLEDFAANGLWHMHPGLQDEKERRAYFWSAVAAMAPEFEYDYEVYREAVEKHNSSSGREERSIYLLPLPEYVKVLDVREGELLRIVRAYLSGGWDEFRKANDWKWPFDWGHISWGGPVVMRGNPVEATRELAETRYALARYRSRLLREQPLDDETPAR